MGIRVKRTIAAVVTVFSARAVTACASTAGSSSPPMSEAKKPCGTVNIADNPWVGYEADLAVVAYILKNDLGCTVRTQNLTEEGSWQGFVSGTVDVILENWGNDDLKKQYIDQQGIAEEMGETGNNGVVGWYVPPWLAEAHPDLLNYQNLNEYAAQFSNSGSKGKGVLMDGAPSYVTNDKALVKDLGLNFTVEYAGSENALIKDFRDAQNNHTWMIGYFRQPQWFLSEEPLARVTLPAHTPGCDAVPRIVKCDYERYDLDKIARTAWIDADSPAVNLIKNFSWTNADQNQVAEYIAEKKMSDDAAAKMWIDANQSKVQAWLKAS